MDGSLGILYPTPDGHAVATRGSFASDQAVHATRIWRERYAPSVRPRDGVTYLFEIVFPANRIVCDYGDLDDLILLGGVDLATGTPIDSRELDWPGRSAATFPYATLGEALAAEPRPGAEGLIVRFPDRDGLMIKLKQEDYLALHKIVTGLNARMVWERLGLGEEVPTICAGLPDEFHGWVQKVAAELFDRRDALIAEVAAEHAKIIEGLPDGWGRKDYAAVAGRSANRGWLFLALDGRDAAAKIWTTLKPAGELRPVNVSEDTA
jgi:RNA ligase